MFTCFPRVPSIPSLMRLQSSISHGKFDPFWYSGVYQFYFRHPLSFLLKLCHMESLRREITGWNKCTLPLCGNTPLDRFSGAIVQLCHIHTLHHCKPIVWVQGFSVLKGNRTLAPSSQSSHCTDEESVARWIVLRTTLIYHKQRHSTVIDTYKQYRTVSRLWMCQKKKARSRRSSRSD